MAPAAGQSEPALSLTTTATYRVMVDEGLVEVTFGYLFENQTTATSFPGFFESIPDDAVDVGVTDGSGELVAGPASETDGFATWLIGFRRPLDPGDSVDVTIRWVIEGGASSDHALVRPGAAAFDVYVPGPEGSSWSPAVIEVPDGFVPMVPVETTRPYEIVRAEYLRHDAFATRTASLPPDLVVADWEEPSEWSAEVVDRAEAVVAALDLWFGPRTSALALRHTFASDEHPAMGADLFELVDDDAESVDHQLAHAWLSDIDVDEPWFVEGLAAAFAGDNPNPSGPADVVPVIVNEIGVVGVRAMVDALRAGTITYPGPTAEPQPLPPDWRTLLDHFEGVADADGVDELFRTGGIDDASAPLLDRRANARVDYEALDFRAGGWSLPPYLRVAMAAWEFDDFTAEQGPVSDVIARRDGLLTWAESLDLPPRDDAKKVFEAAEADMTDVDELLDAQEAALAAFDEAEHLVNGDRGLLARIGLIGYDADADLSALREAWIDGDYAQVEHDGHELASLVEGAVGGGTIRLLVPALGLLALWWLGRIVRRRVGGEPVQP